MISYDTYERIKLEFFFFFFFAIFQSNAIAHVIGGQSTFLSLLAEKPN